MSNKDLIREGIEKKGGVKPNPPSKPRPKPPRPIKPPPRRSDSTNLKIESADKIVFTSGEYAVYETPEGYLIGRPANGMVEVSVHFHPRRDLDTGMPVCKENQIHRSRKLNLATRIANLMVTQSEQRTPKYHPRSVPDTRR